MYPYKYYRYVNLPRLPQNIVEGISTDFDSYERKDPGRVRHSITGRLF
jgi:hypothetical protein